MLRVIAGTMRESERLVSMAMTMSGLTTTPMDFNHCLQITMTQAQTADERCKEGPRSRRPQREAHTSQSDSGHGNSDVIVDDEGHERAGGATEGQGLCETQRAMETSTSRSNRPSLRKDVSQQLPQEGSLHGDGRPTKTVRQSSTR